MQYHQSKAWQQNRDSIEQDCKKNNFIRLFTDMYQNATTEYR